MVAKDFTDLDLPKDVAREQTYPFRNDTYDQPKLELV